MKEKKEDKKEVCWKMEGDCRICGHELGKELFDCKCCQGYGENLTITDDEWERVKKRNRMRSCTFKYLSDEEPGENRLVLTDNLWKHINGHDNSMMGPDYANFLQLNVDTMGDGCSIQIRRTNTEIPLAWLTMERKHAKKLAIDILNGYWDWEKDK